MDSEYEEYDAFEKKMTEKYPAMFSQPYGDFAVGKGWWPILESLCANIQSHIDWKARQGQFIPQVVVEQIKEKFGGLRFYYNGGDATVAGMVRMTEEWANLSCEECGDRATKKTTGWIKNLCETHFNEREERRKASGV